MRKVAVGALIGAMTAIGSAVVSAEQGQTLFSAGAGYQKFDSRRGIEDSALGMMGLEYHLTDEHAFEFRYMQSGPEPEVGRDEYDLYQSNINLLRYFRVSHPLRPFISFGVGMSVLDDEDGTGSVHDLDEVQANLGVGVRYWFNEQLSARLGVEAIRGFDEGDADAMVGFMVSYALGDGPVVVPEMVDSDNDGVRDRDDRCPGTPGGVAVDSKGCSLDSDGDGVPDYRDECPDTPAGREVDQVGCKFVLRETVEMIVRVQFPLNSAEIPEAYQPEIARIAEFLTQYGGVKAVVQGHTDNTGAEAYNKDLSLRRARAVLNALMSRYNIDASRLSAQGFGEEEPIADNSTAEGRQTNRRVVVEMQAEVIK